MRPYVPGESCFEFDAGRDSTVIEGQIFPGHLRYFADSEPAFV